MLVKELLYLTQNFSTEGFPKPLALQLELAVLGAKLVGQQVLELAQKQDSESLKLFLEQEVVVEIPKLDRALFKELKLTPKQVKLLKFFI